MKNENSKEKKEKKLTKEFTILFVQCVALLLIDHYINIGALSYAPAVYFTTEIISNVFEFKYISNWLLQLICLLIISIVIGTLLPLEIFTAISCIGLVISIHRN
ncbi:MAG: hypothetical protein N4A40_12595 [Tissierellales bacterium]|jgi:hypothetical protein|nr:hypothetical protein [Tissierellales bacterium]